MSYPILARLIGRPESNGGPIIVSNTHVAAQRRRAAAAMSAAMTKGDVEGVLAALRGLGVRAVGQGVRHSASEKAWSFKPGRAV